MASTNSVVLCTPQKKLTLFFPLLRPSPLHLASPYRLNQEYNNKIPTSAVWNLIPLKRHDASVCITYSLIEAGIDHS